MTAAPAARPRPTRAEATPTIPVSAFLRPDGTPVRDGDAIVLRAAADDWDDVSVLKEPGRSGEVGIPAGPPYSTEAFFPHDCAAFLPSLLRTHRKSWEV